MKLRDTTRGPQVLVCLNCHCEFPCGLYTCTSHAPLTFSPGSATELAFICMSTEQNVVYTSLETGFNFKSAVVAPLWGQFESIKQLKV